MLRTLRTALEEYGRSRQVLADNGTQFRNAIGELGTKYSKFLYMVDVEAIFARARHPQTKGKLERWFGTAKQSFLGEARFHVEQHPETTLAEFNNLLDEWIRWYNNDKPHRSLENNTNPAKIYFKHPKRIHRPLISEIDWDRWFLVTGTRKVSKYNTISYKKETIQLPPGHAGCKVEVLESEGRVEVYHKDDCLVSHEFNIDYEKVREKRFQRKVKANGYIAYRGVDYYAGGILSGKTIIVRELDQGKKIAIYLDGNLVFDCDKKKKRVKRIKG